MVGLGMTEGQYQTRLIKNIKKRFPNCIVLKNDPSFQQGFPDLTILWEDYWAALEVKAYATASVQPNQDYYIERLGDMSFSAFIYPENEEEVLSALQQAFESSRRACVS